MSSRKKPPRAERVRTAGADRTGPAPRQGLTSGVAPEARPREEPTVRRVEADQKGAVGPEEEGATATPTGSSEPPASSPIIRA